MMRRFSGGTPEGRAAVIAQEPIGRMGTPEEIAAAVVWLCSDAASFATGHAMVVSSAAFTSSARVTSHLMASACPPAASIIRAVS